MNAAERILSYYAPTVGMAGLDLGQLMTGITVPTTIDGQSSSIGFSNPFGGIYVDSFINGGTWSNGLPVGALGVHPEDLIVDGCRKSWH